MNATPEPFPSREHGRLFIDATGLLLNLGGATPTGIPRVEDFLVRAALADPDERIDVVAFRRRRGGFQLLSDAERAQLLKDGSAAFPAGHDRTRGEKLVQALKQVREFPSAGREVDRSLASIIAGGRRQGFDFHAAKAGIRSYRFYRRLRDSSINDLLQSRAMDDRRGILLLSNPMFLRDAWRGSITDGTSIAFICHDLIPTQRPDFTISNKHAQRFREGLDFAMRSGAIGLCASDKVAADYCAYAARTGVEVPAPRRFPMPSILHEMAVKRGLAGRLEAGEPFALYCSTVEVRKNHLMLARIWLKALRNGIRLPKLFCVGKPGWGTEELNAFLAEHPELDDLIVFTGPLGDDRLIDLYRSATFGVFPSHMEGWGLPASECLDFGLPLIVSKAPALLEATRGLMPSVEADDETGWYDTVIRMAQDSAWRGQLAGRIAAEHRPAAVSDSWAAIKSSLLDPVEAAPAVGERLAAASD